ncbi:hypothetical protein CNX65_21375 [Actinosynnema pretiosum]|uniref:DUF4132 domain-containing protein n=1 Tax=Actinosynnema pretiosum TaxID=42197 RepID=A0A290Z975_9PSEU|nr:hypothetical protein CNX65_21375 [Actinosynnema pretiosum]
MDGYVMGAARARQVLPRRGDGRGPGAPVVATGQDRAVVNALVGRARDAVHPSGEHYAALNALFAGHPEPMGAALLYHALFARVHSSSLGKALALLVVDWIDRHGLPFAAEAVLAATGIRMDGGPVLVDGRTAWRHERADPDAPYSSLLLFDRGGVVLRHALATAPDEVRAAALAAMQPHRDVNMAARVLASFLAPDEGAWADDLFARVGAPAPHRSGNDFAMLAASARTPDDLDRFLHLSDLEGLDSRGWALPTLVDAIGPEAALPRLVSLLPRLTKALRGKVLDLVAEFPSDAAFAVVVEHADAHPAPLRAARKLFPERASRLRPAAPAPKGHGLPEAPPTDLPRPLADPPWEARRVEFPRVKGLRVIDRPGESWLPGEREEWASRPLPAHLVGTTGLPELATPASAASARPAGPSGTPDPGAAASPTSGAASPTSGAASPVSGAASPGAAAALPVSGAATALDPAPASLTSGAASPGADAATAPDLAPASLRSGAASPGADAAPPASGATAPDPAPTPSIDWPEAVRATIAGEYGAKRQHAVLLNAPPDLLPELLERWEPASFWDLPDWGPRLVATRGHAAATLLWRAPASQDHVVASALLPLTDARSAPRFARWLTSRGGPVEQATEHFTRHGAQALRPLIPALLNRPNPNRPTPAGRDAEAALRVVATPERVAEVLAVAAEYGPEAEAAVRVLLDSDPLDVLLSHAPDLPDWLDAAVPALPPVLLADGRALPESAVRNLLRVLAAAPAARAAGLEPVKRVCAPEPLARFGFALLRLWLREGAEPKHFWVLQAQGLLGDDRTAVDLGELAGAWPGQGAHQRAVVGLDALVGIGTKVAMHQLDTIARKAKFTSVERAARARVQEVSAKLGLTGEQFADLVVPDFGLTAGEVFDYGPRRFTLAFDELLTPLLVTADGKRRKSAPKLAATDDPELAQAAQDRFKALCRGIRTVARDQLARMERAMVSGRTWTVREFREVILGHPLLRDPVERLVLSLLDGDRVTHFRLSEDGTAADLSETTVPLPDDALLRITHPVHLGPDVAAWSELFADYEIVQPFQQLGRRVFTLTDEERAGSTVTRFDGVPAKPGRLLGLLRQGWERRNYGQSLASYPSDDVVMQLTLSRDLPHSSFDSLPDIQVGPVRLLHGRTEDNPKAPDHPPLFADQNPVQLSEALAALATALQR